MRVAKIMQNDVVNGEGICVSLWMQGCPHHCVGCHNQQTWDPGGVATRKRSDVSSEVLALLTQNGITRNFSVLGGEPLAPYNLDDTLHIIGAVRKKLPDIKIYLWTGYSFENFAYKTIFKDIDYIIDGLYEEDCRDLSLKLRGSSNQRIIDVKKTLENENNEVILYSL